MRKNVPLRKTQTLPECSYAAHDHDRPDDADPFVLGRRAGELLADHDVHVILGEGVALVRW